ncbi:MAG TPA: hypothetical protein VMS12_12100 [Thermoanaerobaculia bacterium]|nr:hypothetical protein [Thermoanaerobaculia bacterium]
MIEWVPIIGIVGLFATISLFIYASNQSRQARTAAHAALQTRMLDKFGSSEDFVAFLRTAEGQRFLESPERQTDRSTERILSTIRWGVTMTIFGAGLFIPMLFVDRGFLVPATMIVSLGIGLLLSGLVSRKLSKTWQAERAIATT